MNVPANFISLDQNYSTTRLVSTKAPDHDDSNGAEVHSLLFLASNSLRKGEGGLRTKGYYKKSIPEKAVATVITVVFNGERYLEETILSVINQTYDNVEYIIIDGGSTDNTINLIKKYEDKIDYWVSEKDGGIYDAMNKGISLSSGVMTNLLNADDYYYGNNVIANVMERVVGNGNTIYVGDTLLVGTYGSAVFECKHKIDRLYFQIPFMHPSCFIPMVLYRQHGLHSLSYKIASDVDFLMRLIYGGTSITRLSLIAVAMRQGGLSNSSFIRGRKEYAKIYFKHSRDSVGMVYGLVKSILFYYLSKMKGILFHG